MGDKRTQLRQPSTIRAFFLTPMLRELERSGMPIDGYLRQFGLSAGRLTSLYERVPLRSFVALAEDASQCLDRPFLGLELGQRFLLSDLGPFFAMFVLSKTLQSALDRLARYESAWQTNTLLDLVNGPETSTCRYCIEDPSIWPRRQDAEFALASYTTFVRQLTHHRWRPLAVEFEHSVSGREHRLREFFNAPVHGDCASNALIIATKDLEQPLRWRLDSEEDLAPALELHLLDLLGTPEGPADSLSERAGRLIAKRLGSGPVTIDTVAAEMEISVRSLRRHLTEEGTSFREILRAHRQTMIESILRSHGGRLSDIAHRLSYSDSAVLSRAFKAWTGMSPKIYAKSQRGGAKRPRSKR